MDNTFEQKYTTVSGVNSALDSVEEEVFKMDIITSFEYRGWGLYECLDGDTSFDSLADIKNIVTLGRAKTSLKYDVHYILLPLSENDADWSIVRNLIFTLREQGRGPYFVEIEEGYDGNDKWVRPVGSFLIDSIVIEPPILHLIIDRRLSNVQDGFKAVGDDIEIHFADLYKIRKQLMMSLREA